MKGSIQLPPVENWLLSIVPSYRCAQTWSR